jgi:hypothetical protein
MSADGIELAAGFYRDVVGPLLLARWPGLPHAAGRLGTGSDVLGLDDAMSRDHDWGLRLSVFVAADMVDAVSDHLVRELPPTYAGFPTAFAMTTSPEERHRVDVQDAASFVMATLGFDPRLGVSGADWLSLTGQSVLEVTAGPIFADTDGAITEIRRALAWYPDDIWRSVIACDWQRLDHELPLMSRAGDRGDDLGSRVIAARLVAIAMHLGFMLERRWPPYPKWLGTMFVRLPRASLAADALAAVLSAETWHLRQQHLAAALEVLADVQRGTGIATPSAATASFFDRPYIHLDRQLVEMMLADVVDEQLRRPGLGSIEQRSDNVALLVDPAARRAAVQPPF